MKRDKMTGSAYLNVFRGIFDEHHEGVIITDREGSIIYYNTAQSRIDDISPNDAIGYRICDVYNIKSEHSPTMQVLRTGAATHDDVHFYRTRRGRLVNSACHIYPLVISAEFQGAISFIQEYSVMEQEAAARLPLMATKPQKKGNGPETEDRKFKNEYKFSSIVGKNANLLEVIASAKLAAKTVSPVLLIGETGVGKEVFAHSIHKYGGRHKGPYTAVNCSAVPESLLEGILFGTTKGAFTGAVDKLGLFESSQGGTVFLDEVDSMPIGLQSKLLRVLQEMRIRRVGSLHENPIDVKIISSVGRSPSEGIAGGLLRKDFYYRIGVVQLRIPSLRERMDDLPLLVQYFVKVHTQVMGMAPPLISPEVMAAFYCYDWPGNVRELGHVIEAVLNILGNETIITIDHIRKVNPEFVERLASYGSEARFAVPITVRGSAPVAAGIPMPAPPSHPDSPAKHDVAASPEKGTGNSRMAAADGVGEMGSGGRLHQDMMEMEKTNIIKSLRTSSGNITTAAKLLGISPQLMHYKLKKYTLRAKDYVPKSL